MFWEALIYFVVAVGIALAQIYGTEYVKFYFKKKEKALDNNIEKPTFTLIQNITNNYFGNKPELPK